MSDLAGIAEGLDQVASQITHDCDFEQQHGPESLLRGLALLFQNEANSMRAAVREELPIPYNHTRASLLASVAAAYQAAR